MARTPANAGASSCFDIERVARFNLIATACSVISRSARWALSAEMLTPSVLTVINPFYAIGNTPAVSFTRDLPQGVDADVLLLGCGDVRNILFTAYAEKGFREYSICDLFYQLC